ncbi:MULTISPECIES: hypothetical protein [Sinorhizobium]|uniref:hypothetical protein n=1 Tax=Sinorhizobium sp. NG07B TaxID=1538174 RepID=UPI000D4568E6|nr:MULTISPECIES: hypothetical protein [Sinorhizobium]POH25010.1 hypothetical protein ATY30_28625 [Sinorhizobium americanum]
MLINDLLHKESMNIGIGVRIACDNQIVVEIKSLPERRKHDTGCGNAGKNKVSKSPENPTTATRSNLDRWKASGSYELLML